MYRTARPPAPEGVWVPAEGPDDAEVAFVGEGPGYWEAVKGKAFVGPTGKLLWNFSVKYMGLKRRDVWLTNLAKIRMTDKKGKDRGPTDKERERWGKALWRELAGIQPKYIIAFGRHATHALIGRAVNMESVHGLPFRMMRSGIKSSDWNPIVIPVFHPAAGLHQEKLLPYTAIGMQMAAAIIKGKGPQAFLNPVGKKSYRIGLPKKMPTGAKEIIGMDTEGNKKHPHCVQVSWEPRKAWLVKATDARRIKKLKKYIDEEKPTIVLHYALHDMKTLRDMGIDLLPAMDDGRVRDTLIYAANGTAEPGELKALAERHLRIPVERYEQIVAPIREEKLCSYLWDMVTNELIAWPPPVGRAHSIPKRLQGIMKTSKAAKPKTVWQRWREKKFKPIRDIVEAVVKFEEPTLEELGGRFKDYACADPDYTRRVFFLLKMKTDKQGLGPAIDGDHNALPLIYRMERAGMEFDKAEWKRHMAHLAGVKTGAQMASAMLTKGVVDNPSSGDDVAEWCAQMAFPLSKLTKGKTRMSVDDDVLKSIRNLHPAINHFIDYRAAVKQIGICAPLIDMVDEDGRLRYRFNYGKVRTGRRSMGGGDESEANLLAFPKRGDLGKRSRKLFVAKSGHVFGSCDASQIELRVAAGLSQDKVMMRAYEKGEDLHALTAVRMSGCSWDEAKNNDDIRIPWKTANFALLYLASAQTLLETYVANGITRFSLLDCENIRKDWFKLYKGIDAYFKSCIQEARRTGYTQTPYGRKRMLPCIDLPGDEYPMNFLREGDERKACNTPIQGGAFELIKRAEARLARYLSANDDWFTPVLEIHDDLMFEVPKGRKKEARRVIQKAMGEDSPFKGVPLETDWKQGPSWGELERPGK